MTFFSRTSSGLSAENLFRDVEYIICIEGKSKANDIEKIYDYRFYNSLLKALFDKPYVLKVKGCKQELLTLSKKLDDGQINNHIIIVDRDHDEIIPNTPLTDRQRSVVRFTHGYSWENDFWSTKLIRALALFHGLSDEEIERLVKSFKVNERRFKFMHYLNLLSRANGSTLFELKGWCGIAPQKGPKRDDEKKILFVITKDEVSQRIIKKWTSLGYNETPETLNAKSLIARPGYSHEGFIIQGHSYEYLVLELLAEFYNISSPYSTGGSSKPLFKSAAFGLFAGNPLRYLSRRTIQYYESVFKSFT